jgi:DNA-directed RNA polymerase specialized sigma24 family protein
VALSAFDSFCRGVAGGRFPQLNDRHDLWQVLVTLTARKAIDAVRRERAIKRQAPNAVDGAVPALEQIIGREPTPSFAAEVADECRRLVELLEDPDLRSVALCKLEGHTNREIADRLGWSLATIERRLVLIRRIWEERDLDG